VANGDEDDPGHPLYWQRFLAEAGARYEAQPAAPPALETLRQLYSSVLANYGFACAMTGRQFEPPRDFLHDHLEIAAIRPLVAGGALHVSNFLCLEQSAALAFRQGHIAIGNRYELLVDLSRLDPELLERLNPPGRLRLPEAGIARPDLSALAYHRANVFLST
jgi:predicted restriction endonuclease